MESGKDSIDFTSSRTGRSRGWYGTALGDVALTGRRGEHHGSNPLPACQKNFLADLGLRPEFYLNMQISDVK